MQLQIGKRYVTRAGEVTTPLEDNNGRWYPFSALIGGGKATFNDRGQYYTGSKDNRDLVAEYVEPVIPLTELEQEVLDALKAVKGFMPTSYLTATSVVQDIIDKAESRIPKPEPLVLVAGKRYVNRNGDITNPLESRYDSTFPFGFKVWGSSFCFTANGAFLSGKHSHSYDLVSEYVEA